MAKPKLTVFLCALLLIGALGVMALSSVCSSAADAFETHYMFTYIPGRVVVARPTGESIDKELAATLKDATGADSMLRFDRLLDQASYSYAELRTGEGYYDYEHLYLECGWGESADNIVGRYPEKPNEVLLMLPISYKTVVGSSEILTEELSYLGLDLKVVGASYYADNNITPKCIFTEQGFEYATYSNYIIQRASTSATITVHGNGNKVFGAYEIVPVFDFGGKIYLENSDFISYLDSTPETDDVDINLSCIYYTYNYTSGDGSTTIRFEKDFDESYLSPYAPKEMRGDRYNNVLYIDASILAEMGCAVLDASYRQVSLFFENDAEAYKAAAKLEEMGYIAVPSDTTYQPDAFTVIANLILSVMMGLVFIFGIVFLAFFINLCSSRAIGAIRPDIAIMRSMGIPVSTIRVGMFTRMFLSLIPAFISIAVFGILICTVPAINNIFTYLYLWQYALIAVGIIALCARVTYKQMKNLFGESVKNALRGGDAA